MADTPAQKAAALAGKVGGSDWPNPSWFTLREFEVASQVALTAAQKESARWWVVNVLDPTRAHFGRPLRLGSFVRSMKPANSLSAGQVDNGGHSASRNGESVDITVDGVSPRVVADYIASRFLDTGVVWQVIDETTATGGAHTHITRSQIPGATAGYLVLASDRRTYNLVRSARSSSGAPPASSTPPAKPPAGGKTDGGTPSQPAPTGRRGPSPVLIVFLLAALALAAYMLLAKKPRAKASA